MTRAEIMAVLRGFIREYRIDPHDAGLVLQMVDDNEVDDAETLGDLLDGQGYPELAEEVYAL